MHLLIVLLAFTPCLAAAVCECGYSSKGPQEVDGPWLFTDVVESDFTKIANISQDKDWVRQQFNVSAKDGRGKYGKAFGLDNIASRPTASLVKGGPAAGLDLRVGTLLDNDAVPGAEIDSARMDMHWGSYRAGMKLTSTNGTCAAFFWVWLRTDGSHGDMYFNDTQEIDMEFLSREYTAGKQVYPVNLVIQSKQSMEAGYDASKTGTFQRVNLTFDPTDGFHEYRFDYLPGRVMFYADSEKLAEMKGDAIPSDAGHLILQHWSNGNPLWSGGPPTQDAFLTVNYVKAYFNSSDAKGNADWSKRCADTKSAVCTVADVTAGNASTGGQFFTDQGPKGSEVARYDAGRATMLMAVLAVVVIVTAL
ncbi:Beta-glucanase [Tolypocladium ophioglossoides CBS 100239]|uniref:Beta-glucanase n=1 Tax=Tolypocladium ophioglossoides (strain CBS 100239) TaxID=1163406 RepID=A0A0L0NGB9_TOLOC|nr:Beta-glucanase [Tolypocladium ophioglossoides CBS 100239]